MSKKAITKKQATKRNVKASKNTKNSKNTIFITIIITSLTLAAIVIAYQAVQTLIENNQISLPQDNTTQETDTPTQAQDTTQTSIEDTNTEPTTEEQKEEIVEAQEETQEEDTKQQTLTIYFVRIKDDNTIALVPVTRQVDYSPAILTNTVNSLLQGNTAEEAQNGLFHYIPSNSVLNSASVSQGVATLDFNEDFQFNELGSAGTKAQLYQIIFTCTAIPSIDSVQITINKQKIPYLGGEGNIDISKPITRADLDSI